MSLGAAVTPLNPLQTPAELATQLRDAGARLIVAAPPLLAAAQAAADGGPVLGLDALAGTAAPPAVASIPATSRSSPTRAGRPGCRRAYSSTTARSSPTSCSPRRARVGAGDVVAGVLPFFHAWATG